MGIAHDIIRETVRARLGDFRREREAARLQREVEASRAALARVEQERDSWQEIALAAQRRVEELDKELARARAAARAT